jgi:hypothetical protein
MGREMSGKNDFFPILSFVRTPTSQGIISCGGKPAISCWWSVARGMYSYVHYSSEDWPVVNRQNCPGGKMGTEVAGRQAVGVLGFLELGEERG